MNRKYAVPSKSISSMPILRLFSGALRTYATTFQLSFVQNSGPRQRSSIARLELPDQVTGKRPKIDRLSGIITSP